eukprot:6210665-Pleurochrysis_carterae.AAC.3
MAPNGGAQKGYRVPAHRWPSKTISKRPTQGYVLRSQHLHENWHTAQNKTSQETCNSCLAQAACH